VERAAHRAALFLPQVVFASGAISAARINQALTLVFPPNFIRVIGKYCRPTRQILPLQGIKCLTLGI
jgi:hypothetical protein